MDSAAAAARARTLAGPLPLPTGQ